MSVCWSCKAPGKCFSGCGCQKCVDPVGWEQAIRNHPHKFGNGWKSVKEMDAAKHQQLEACGQGRLDLSTASEDELIKERGHQEDKEAGLLQAIADTIAKLEEAYDKRFQGKTTELNRMQGIAIAAQRILARVLDETWETAA